MRMMRTYIEEPIKCSVCGDTGRIHYGWIAPDTHAFAGKIYPKHAACEECSAWRRKYSMMCAKCKKPLHNGDCVNDSCTCSDQNKARWMAFFQRKYKTRTEQAAARARLLTVKPYILHYHETLFVRDHTDDREIWETTSNMALDFEKDRALPVPGE